MKKDLFLLAAAVVVMAGCSKTEMVEMPDSAVIGFGNAYIGNPIQSRAVSTLTTANIDAFYVYGGHDNSLTNTFDGTKVSKSGGTWSYSPVRYWNAGTTYRFAAYAPEIPDGKGTVGTDDANGRLTFTDYVCDPDNQLDLIYAEQSTTAQAENNSPVSFNFQHLLSMIKFTFKSGFPNDVPVTVSELKVYGMAAQGTYNNGWTPDETQAVAEGAPFNELVTTTAENTASQATQAASANFVVIPQSGGSVTVSFKAAVSLDASEVKTKEFTTTLVPAWEAGNCYNYVATITEQNMEVESITYDDPTVTEWVEQEIESGIGTMVVVNEAGNLATLLANAQADQITSLKINGDLNEEDFQYIRENLSALETLDLSGTDLTVFPDRALAFYDDVNTTLKEVILPEGLTTIEDAAFANCTALTRLDVPATVTELGQWILENTAVSSFTIPDGVTEIPTRCFYGSALTSMVVPSTVTSFATIYKEDNGDCSWAFVQCMQLTSLVIEAPVTTIPNDFCLSTNDEGTLIKNSLTSLVLPDEVETIGTGAFNGCPITNLQLPANLKSIGDEAFAYCEITELILPEGFTTLKGGAFRNAPLKKLDLPSTIEDLSTNSHVWLFNGANLEEVICRDSNPPALSQSYSPFCDVEHFTFVNETCVLKVPAASVDTYKDSDWAKYFKNIEAMTD